MSLYVSIRRTFIACEQALLFLAHSRVAHFARPNRRACSQARTFIRRFSMIVRVNIVLNRTVVVDSDWRFDNLCSSNVPSQSELHDISWWYYILCGSCIIQWIEIYPVDSIVLFFEQLRPVWAALKYRRDQKRIKEITNLRMKHYMINSIVQTILLTAFLMKFA